MPRFVGHAAANLFLQPFEKRLLSQKMKGKGDVALRERLVREEWTLVCKECSPYYKDSNTPPGWNGSLRCFGCSLLKEKGCRLPGNYIDKLMDVFRESHAREEEESEGEGEDEKDTTIFLNVALKMKCYALSLQLSKIYGVNTFKLMIYHKAPLDILKEYIESDLSYIERMQSDSIRAIKKDPSYARDIYLYLQEKSNDEDPYKENEISTTLVQGLARVFPSRREGRSELAQAQKKVILDILSRYTNIFSTYKGVVTKVYIYRIMIQVLEKDDTDLTEAVIRLIDQPYREIITSLIDGTFDGPLEDIDIDVQSSLYIAVLAGNLEVIQRILDMSGFDRFGSQMFKKAFEIGNIPVMRLVLENGDPFKNRLKAATLRANIRNAIKDGEDDLIAAALEAGMNKEIYEEAKRDLDNISAWDTE